MRPSKRYLSFTLLLFCTTAFSAEPRFSGGGGLSKPAEVTTSADRRFNLSAELRPAAVLQSTGRFSLSAKLQPDARTLAVACGPVADDIFKNGFE